ncbi:SMI1/KNR4 family protein [Streptomyces sp. H39-S7]|uniref:SMI1/KNR4 family protein n=1 Tax=Streptomyces sp. H39-S7 TaxID=3004357 RepID=UPI0022AEE63C|nr:SMI1/KNR4 family protein [Streptomyces sp. H39-S7]MCZ4119788.1 SMI1/KNR4 family protein [Streptomyces sp. H39-S7]
MDAKTFDWRAFLTRWSEEWADAQGDLEDLSPDDAEDRQRRWLGVDPAAEADIATMKARLGLEMPPSYKEFLRVSNGWRHAGGFVWMLAGTREAHWHEDASGLGEDFDEFWGEEDNPQEVRAQVGLWSRALQLDVESDATYVLLDPEDVGPDGEWAVRVWASWRASDPERYPSFAAFMVAMHQEFHSLEAGRNEPEGAPAFDNETTRAQDAAVLRARTAALRGRHDDAVRLLLEAQRYGRPRATELLHQLALLGGPHGEGQRQPHPGDPRFLTELLPLHASDLLNSGRPADDWPFADPDHFPDTAHAAAVTLREVSEGTYRYRPGGTFGEAVDQARELARWGNTDAAWRTLRAAIPQWEPLGPDHIAPVGLLADPVLAPVLTSERRTELLATPRGGEAGPAPTPTGDQDPGGLSWLARPDALRPVRSSPCDFRVVLVEGVAPDGLPIRLGSSPDTALSPPLRRWEVDRHHRPAQRSFSGYDDRALLSVGRAGAGWSFGFEENPSTSFSTERFTSPAPAASAAGGRAIVVWSEWRRHTPVFHLSVAQGGTLLYAFTVRDGAIEDTTGNVPAELTPTALGFETRDAAAQTAAAARALDAIAELYGVTLPRLALTEGRLHSFETVSWIRPPGPGDTYMTITVG